MAKTKARRFYWRMVEVYVASGEKRTVKALVYGDSGLCINQYDPDNPAGKFISVTHINTGKRMVSSFNEARTARQFCEAVSTLMDWNEITDDKDLNQRYPNIGQKIRALRALVVEHRENWRKALVEKILNEGGLVE